MNYRDQVMSLWTTLTCRALHPTAGVPCQLDLHSPSKLGTHPQVESLFSGQNCFICERKKKCRTTMGPLFQNYAPPEFRAGNLFPELACVRNRKAALNIKSRTWADRSPSMNKQMGPVRWPSWESTFWVCKHRDLSSNLSTHAKPSM